MFVIAAALIAGTVINVHDGDTFRIGDTRIRLAAIDANEMNGSCHNECAAMSPTASRTHGRKTGFWSPMLSR